MKCSLRISNFLEEISSLSHSIVFLYFFALITEECFLISPFFIDKDKRAFFSNQCEEIEENNRMGKTRDLFKKIRDTKGTFHTKMGSIKDRNGMDLTEAEDIKKRWQDGRNDAKAESPVLWPPHANS